MIHSIRRSAIARQTMPLGGLSPRSLLFPRGPEERLLLNQLSEALESGSRFARDSLSRCFRDIFSQQGKLVIGFIEHLLDQYLTFSKLPTCLVFLLNGATPMLLLSQKLAAPEKQRQLFGLILQKPTIERRTNHPGIIHDLYQAGILNYRQIIIVDTGYRGSIGKTLGRMLDDDRLLDHAAEEHRCTYPGRNWAIKTELLCLRTKHHHPTGSDINGYNLLVEKNQEIILDRLAYLIDEGISPGGKRAPFAIDRQLLTKALIEAADTISF